LEGGEGGGSAVVGRQTTQTTIARRRPMVKRDPLIVTPAAAARIAYLIDAHNSTGGRGGNNGSACHADADRAVGIRLGTKKRGCNGLSYTLNYAYSDHPSNNPRDEVMIISFPSEKDAAGNGLRVYVEPMALMNVIGTTMDFADDEMSSEFTFTNPNSKGECGCGESFNV
jgi:iron-sulfur cluster assembly accessory protein